MCIRDSDTREAVAKKNDLLSPGVLRITAHISGTNLDKMYGRGYADGGIVKRADGGIDGNGTYVDRVPQVARRRNILWGETDIPDVYKRQPLTTPALRLTRLQR